MKIAIYHNLGPGGALRTVSEFVQRAVDHECTVFTLDFGPQDIFQDVDPGMTRRDLSKYCDQVRVPVRPPKRWLDAEGFERLHLLRQLRRAERHVGQLIDRAGFDVAFVHPCWLTQSPSVLKDLRTPSLYLMQEVRRASFEPGYRVRSSPTSAARVPGWLADELVHQVIRLMDIRAVDSATTIINNSAYSQKQAHAAYGRPTSVCHLGVDTALFQPSPQPLPLSAPYVLSVGGMEEFKGHHLVIEALGLISKDSRPELLVVYERCDPSYLDEVRQLAQRNEVVLNEFPGISDADLVELYRGALATVAAAKLEPLGLVPLESIACGTPVVVTNEGGYVETTKDGVNGFHVERSPEAIASGLRRILSGELAVSKTVLRESILPYWSIEAKTERQLDALDVTANWSKPS